MARSLEIIGGPGAEPGQFSNPWGVALDSAGNLYVADSQNHRVQKLHPAAGKTAVMNLQFTHPYFLLLLVPAAGLGDLVCLESDVQVSAWRRWWRWRSAPRWSCALFSPSPVCSGSCRSRA